MTLRTSLIITGDTAGGQKAVNDLTAATRRAAEAADSLGASERGAAAASEGLSQELQQAQAAAGALEAGLRQTGAAGEALAADLKSLTTAHAALVQENTRLATELRQSLSAVTALASEAQQARAAIGALEGELQQSKAAATAFETALSGANADIKALTDRVTQLEAQLANGSGGRKRFANELDEGAKAANRHQYAVRNAGQQVGDFGLQVASGQDPARAFSQQIGQLGYAISEMGGTVGKVGAFLTGPWGIALTIAAAVLAPLVENLVSSKDAADKAADALDEFKKRQSDIKNFIDETTGALKEQNRTLVLNATLTRQKAIDDNNKQIASQRQSAIDLARRAGTRTEYDPEQRYGNHGAHTVLDPDISNAIQAANGDVDKLAQSIASLAQKSRPDLKQLALDLSTQAGAAIQATRENEQLNKELQALNGNTSALHTVTTGDIDARVAVTTATTAQARAQAEFNETMRKARAEYDASKKTQADQLKYQQQATEAQNALNAANAAARSDRTAQRNATRDARQAVTNGEYGRDAADRIAAIKAQFDETPSAARRAEQAIRQIDDIMDDLGRKKPPNFQATIATARQAKQAIQSSLTQPYNDLIASQRDQLDVQRLIVAGRYAEADALRQTQQLQKAMPALTKQQRDAILANAQAARELAAAESIDNYVDNINDQIAALRTLDPIQREMLQVRKELLALAPAERVAAEARIAAAIAEREALERAAATREEIADLAHEVVSAFNDIAVGGDKAGDVIKRLAQSIAAAVVQAELLGTGPLASLLGTASGDRGQLGGLVGSLFKSGRHTANDNAGSGGGFFGLVGANDNAPSIAATNNVADAIGKATGKEFDKSLNGVFGQGGAFAQTLKFGGIGYVAGNVTGSGTGGALGGIAGGFAGEKLLSGLLGSAAGPVGSIVGGLLGGLVGGLFGKPKPTGTASLTGGDATITGNSGETRQAAGSLADQVQSGLKQIADQLGGALGGYSLAIGEFDGKYRVNTNATTQSLNYNNFNASTLHNFGSDQAGAVSFAIEDAIKDGAVKGLSAAVQQALKSSTNVDDALQEALKVADLEQLLGGVNAQLDKAFSDFEKEAQDRLRIAKQYGLDVVAVEKLNAKERIDLQKQLLDQQVGSLQHLIDELTGGSLFEGTSVEKRDALLKQIDAAKADLDAGVDGAADKLAGLFEQLDQVSKDVYGTTGGFADDRQSILDQARAAIAKANADIAAAQAKATDPALATTNAALDENNDQNARMIAALEQNNTLLKTIAGNTASGNDLDTLRQLARSAA